MHKILLIRLSFWALAAGSILLAAPACKKSNHDSPSAPAPESYRTVQEKDSAWGFNYPEAGMSYSTISLSDFQYDDKGNQVSAKFSANSTFSDGTAAESSISSVSQFDKRGFLISGLTERVDISRSGQATPITNSTSYQYDQDRLARRVDTYGNPARVDITSYRWDAAGNLTDSRDTVDGSFKDLIHYDYFDGNLFKVTASNNSTSYSPFVEVNEHGWFIKTIDQGREHRYQYDAEGEIIREEYWKNGLPSTATAYELDRNKNAGLLEYPLGKGFPTIEYISTSYGIPLHNYTKITYFIPDASGQWKKKNYVVYSYTYSSSGYPETKQEAQFDAAGVKLANGSRSIYTYTSF